MSELVEYLMQKISDAEKEIEIRKQIAHNDKKALDELLDAQEAEQRRKFEVWGAHRREVEMLERAIQIACRPANQLNELQCKELAIKELAEQFEREQSTKKQTSPVE
jgi:hypothetical protein